MSRKRGGAKMAIARRQPGRPKIGTYTWLHSSTLPPEKAWLARMADRIVDDYAADLGGNPTTAELLLLAGIKRMIVYTALIDLHVAESGLFKAPGELQACMTGFYLAALNGIKRHVELLGLKRVDRAEQSLQQYIEANYGKDKAKALEPAQEGGADAEK